MGDTTLRRTEAKAFFANERTFLHWLSMSVKVGAISAALLGVAGHAHKHWGGGYEARAIFVRVLALILLFGSILMASYAGYMFHKRGDMLMARMDGPYDTRILPIMLTAIVGATLIIVFAGTVASYEAGV